MFDDRRPMLGDRQVSRDSEIVLYLAKKSKHAFLHAMELERLPPFCNSNVQRVGGGRVGA